MSSGTPSPDIVNMSRKMEVDCIIMGTKGKGVFGRMLSGSVSTYVMQHAPCPVVVVRSSNQHNLDGNKSIEWFCNYFIKLIIKMLIYQLLTKIY